jgi:hypothetical protein
MASGCSVIGPIVTHSIGEPRNSCGLETWTSPFGAFFNEAGLEPSVHR